MKVIRNGDEITLVSANGGWPLAWLLLIEVAVLGVLMAHLASAVQDLDVLVWPGLASVALIGWTAMQIKPDYRIVLNLAERQGRVMRIAPLTGTNTAASFALDEVDSLALQQTVARAFGRAGWTEYVVAIELRDGGRHVLSLRGPLLAYREIVARFSAAAGIGSRVVRL